VEPVVAATKIGVDSGVMDDAMTQIEVGTATVGAAAIATVVITTGSQTLGGGGFLQMSHGCQAIEIRRLELAVRLERGGGGTERCQKMKRRQRAHLNSMGRKRDTTR
jgi:hypothetical protein